MDWVAVTEASITEHLPTDVLSRYTAWVSANPSKAGRLSEIVTNQVALVRDSIATNPANTLDPDESTVPLSVLQHLETRITFYLLMEMGESIDTAGMQSMTRADMFIRQLAYDRFSVNAEDQDPTPAYTVPAKSDGRALPALVLALALLAAPAFGGWIRPGSQISDTSVFPTYVPSAYTPSALTLYGYLQGIDTAIGNNNGLASALSAETNFREDADHMLEAALDSLTARLVQTSNYVTTAYALALAAAPAVAPTVTNATLAGITTLPASTPNTGSQTNALVIGALAPSPGWTNVSRRIRLDGGNGFYVELFSYGNDLYASFGGAISRFLRTIDMSPSSYVTVSAFQNSHAMTNSVRLTAVAWRTNTLVYLDEASAIRTNVIVYLGAP